MNKDYGGTGEFVPLPDDAGSTDDLGRPEAYSYMDTVRPSNTSAKVSLYMPTYEPRASSRSVSMNQLVNDFGELGVGEHARRSNTYPVCNTAVYR
jgi:hypothetical protein